MDMDSETRNVLTRIAAALEQSNAHGEQMLAVYERMASAYEGMSNRSYGVAPVDDASEHEMRDLHMRLLRAQVEKTENEAQASRPLSSGAVRA